MATKYRKEISKNNRAAVLSGKPKCFYCGKRASSIDHVVPVSKGGANDITNFVPCCEECNRRKSNFDLYEFRIRQEMRKKAIKPLNADQFKYLKKCGFDLSNVSNFKFYGEKKGASNE